MCKGKGVVSPLVKILRKVFDCYCFQVEIFLSRALSDRSSFYCMVDCHLLEFEMCRYIQMRVTELDEINKVDDYGLAFIYQVSVVIFHASCNYCSDACHLKVCMCVRVLVVCKEYCSLPLCVSMGTVPTITTAMRHSN